jgi:squalene-associated FAD-dependent desaturase
MKKGIVIGGGLAGLSAAVYLLNAGFKIELIEASPKIGGRAYSYFDKELSMEVDNGQHLLMGCYDYTLHFFGIINCLGNLEIPECLEINYVSSDGKSYLLKASSFPYPVNLLKAILGFNILTLSEKGRVLLFFSRLPFINPERLKTVSVRNWLIAEGQSENIINSLWELIAVSALNTSIDKASAKVFCRILKQIFFKGNFSTKLLIPKTGLSKVYAQPAAEFIRNNGGIISLSEKAEGFDILQGEVKKIRTNKREIRDFDFVISTVPLHSLSRLLPKADAYISSFPEINYSSILSLHIKITQNNLTGRFYAFLSSPVHWVFNHGDYISVVISNAYEFSSMEKEKIFLLIKKEISRYLGIKETAFGSYRVINEKRATFVPDFPFIENRPNSGTKLSNFYIAGDWTNTGLPSTIESAVKSGKLVSELVASKLS